jgi:hypothetical protein
MNALQSVITHIESQRPEHNDAANLLREMTVGQRVAFTHMIVAQLTIDDRPAEACQVAMWILTGERRW